MPYLADFLSGLPGFKPRDEWTTTGGYQTAPGGTGTVRGKPKTNLLDPNRSFYDDAGAYGGRTVADLRMGGSALGGVGQPYRNVVPPAMAQQARGMADLDRARLAPVTPGPPAHGTAGWMPPGERGGGPGVPPPMAATGAPAPPGRTPAAPQTMQQAPGGGQPPPMTPAGAGPDLLGRAASGVGNLLGGVGNWMRTPVRNSGLTRGDLVFDALGNIGRGLSTTGNLGQGLGLAVEGQRELFKDARKQRESDEERKYRRLEMELKRRALEQKVAPQPHVLGAGGMLVGPNGEVLARAPTAEKDPTTFEAAALNGTPEQRALALEQLAKRGEPTARDIAYIDSLRASGQHQKAMEEIARIRANRPAGAASQAAPPKLAQMMAARDALPPDHPDRRIWDAAIAKETAQAGGNQGGTPDTFKRAADLRKEFAGLTKNEQEIVTAYGKIKSGFSLKTGAGDIAGIFGYMKMLDPTSAVREGEYATAANAGGVDQSIIAAYNRVLEGDKLTDEQRKEMTAAAGSQMGPYRERYDRLASQYAELARRGQVDPADVLGAGSPFPPPDQAPPPGAPGEPDPYEGLQ